MHSHYTLPHLSLSVPKGPILNKNYIIQEENSVGLLLFKVQTSDRNSPYLPGLRPLIPSRGRGENRLVHHRSPVGWLASGKPVSHTVAPVGKSYVLLINDHESALRRGGWGPCRPLDRCSLDCGNGIGHEQAWRGPISNPKQSPLTGLCGLSYRKWRP